MKLLLGMKIQNNSNNVSIIGQDGERNEGGGEGRGGVQGTILIREYLL